MNVPKLRFKDENGREFPEWEVKALGKIVTIVSGISPSSYSLSKSGIYPFLKVEDLNNCIKYQITSREYSNSTKNLVPRNSIIFPKRGAAILNNKVRISPIPVLMDSNLMALTPINNDVNSEYLYYKIFKDQLFRIADTSSIPQINNKHILPYLILLPGFIEQTKIANFLTAIDEKITQLTQKHDLLKQYKKGVMQRIFSQKLRFKDDDGREFPEWEEKRLSDIAEKIQDGTHFSPELNESGQFLYITSKNVKNGYLDLSTALYVSEQSHNEIYKRCDVKQGDVLITKDGTIGQVCVNPLRKPFSLLSSVAFIRTKERFNNYFLYHLLLSSNGQKEIIKSIAGQALQRITLTKLNNFSYFFPILSEQTKIANFLTAIDEKITHTKTQLDAVKRYKKGLLQQLFV